MKNIFVPLEKGKASKIFGGAAQGVSQCTKAGEKTRPDGYVVHYSADCLNEAGIGLNTYSPAGTSGDVCSGGNA